MKRLLLLLCLPLLFTACDSESDPDPVPVTEGVLVASQGAFGADDGGLAVYDPATDTAQEVYADLYVQSVAVQASRVYLSSLDRVDVLAADGFARVGQYSDVPNPRYFAFDGDRAFVTTLFDESFSDGGLAVLDLASGTVTDTLTLGGNPDGVAVVGNRVYVANFDFGFGSTVTVLNAESLEEVERIDVGCDGPRFLFVDAQSEVLVVCSGQTTFDGDGNVEEQTNGAIVVLSGGDGAEITRADLPTQIGTASVGQDASYSPQAEELVAVHNGSRTLYRFDAASNTLGATLDLGGDAVNAVAYDAVGDKLYVGRLDPDNPFTAEGTVTVHERDGAQTGSFGAGVVPSHIAFLRGTE